MTRGGGEEAERMNQPVDHSNASFSLIPNPRAKRGAGVFSRSFVGGLAVINEALADIRSWPGYSPTPLHSLDGLAHATVVAASMSRCPPAKSCSELTEAAPVRFITALARIRATA